MSAVNFSQLYSFIESAASFKDKKQIILNAMRLSMRPISARMKAGLSGVGTGKLRKSIGVWAGITKARGFTSLAGPRQFGKHKGHHAHLFNNGTKERKTKDGQSRGRMRGRNIFTPIQNNAQTGADALKTNLVIAFERHITNTTRRVSR